MRDDMIKTLFSTLLLLSLALSGPAAAQEFTVEPDSTEGTGYVDSLAVFNSLIVNLWNQENQVRWQRELDLPDTSWLVEICQLSLVCWPPWVDEGTLVMPPEARDSLQVKFHPRSLGVGIVTLYLTALADTTIGEELTFSLRAVDLAVRPEPDDDRSEWLGWDVTLWGGASGISYNLPFSTSVKVSLFDLQGRFIGVAREGMSPAGRNIVRFNGLSDMSSGIYLVRLDACGYEPVYCKTVVR